MSRADDEPIERVKTQQERTLTLIRDIEQRGWKFLEQRGGGDLKDVTAQHLQDKKNDLETLNDMMKAWNAVCA